MQFSDLGIEIKSNHNQQKVRCPKCKSLGKENWKDYCLSINLQKGLYNCHKCGWQGVLKQEKILSMAKTYKSPEKGDLKKLSPEGEQFLLSRGITKTVIQKNKIVSTKDNKNVVFPYIKDGKAANYKKRGIDGKFFSQAKDAEPIIYNYDRCKGSETIVICEGEIDSLSWEVAGVEFHTSVNMGAPNASDKNIDKKLECITNCYDIFEEAKFIYIATDEDANGKRLEEELVRRFGPEKCFLVDLKPFKDANEVLLQEGIESLRNRLKTAIQPKVEGIFQVNDVYESLMAGYEKGPEMGTTTHIKDIDKAWKWRPGEVSIWTGYQNEGKSLFLNQLATLKAFHDSWKFALFTPENMPLNDFFNDIAEMYMGKSSSPFYNNQAPKEEYKSALEFVDKHFYLIYPEDDFTLDSIFDKTKYLIKAKGVRSLIIDPYNTIQHKSQGREPEHLYISRFMSELKKFAVDYNISINLVAHQVTPTKEESGRYPKPDCNRIKGGGTFSDKADNVLSVWRPNRAVDYSDTSVIFSSQKIKKQKLVGLPQDIREITFVRSENRYYFSGMCPFHIVDAVKK